MGEAGEYNLLESKFHGDFAECCSQDKECKKFYRDQIVTLDDRDISNIKKKVEAAVDYISMQHSYDGLQVMS